MSHELKRILAYAAEESEALHHPAIDCGHLVLGLLKLKDHYAAGLLEQHGITYAPYREVIRVFERSSDPEVLETGAVR